ncbi:retrotransposon protein, putative, ty1-copia subclass [Tanacetum coccineum]
MSLILVSLQKEYDSFVQNYNMHDTRKTVNELHAMLKLHEQILPKRDVPALNAIRAGKISPPPKKEDPAKDSICHHCGDTGHWKQNCPQYLSKLLKNKKLPQGASTSVEKAKDLLGLIHTDVCGPFKIVSRQGASYFVTFIDDFSRYGYVYLLKHKHEVFETFKVFQKEVENQLGKTIKSLHFDRGGEYMSQEFLDHLKEHGIIAHRTPPYTPQHNGVSERRNRTLLDMVRSMMCQTTLRKSFWDYALESAARILNMVPTKKVENTPYEVWYGQAPKLSYLKVWGCEDLVDLPSNGKTVGSKWLFKKKADMDGAVHTYKGRLVAKGYTQTPRIDYEENFSPVADIKAIRILIAITAFYDYEIWQMDVKTTFLNGYLCEEVYMEQHEGSVNPKFLNRVCKLKRSIYGLKQASRQ